MNLQVPWGLEWYKAGLRAVWVGHTVGWVLKTLGFQAGPSEGERPCWATLLALGALEILVQASVPTFAG